MQRTTTNCFGRLRMRNQAFIWFLIIFLLMFGIVSLVYYVSISIMVPLLQEASFDLYRTQTARHVKAHLTGYEGMLNGIFDINVRQAQILSQIYNQGYSNLETWDNIVLDPNFQMDYAGLKKIPPILVDKPGIAVELSHSMMCYINKTDIVYPLNRVSLINLKLQETFYPIGQILDQTKLNIHSLFYVGLIEEPQIFFDYPCPNFGALAYKLIIPSRPWFKLGKSIFDKTNFSDYEYAFTDPYLQFTKGKMEVTVSLPLINRKKQFKGVIGSELGTDFNKFIVPSQNEKVYMVLLVDQKGLLIYQSYNVSLALLPIYFHNTTITGFTMEDWEAVTNTKESNCKLYPKKSDLICRYNSVYDKELIMMEQYIPQFKYRFLIFQDTTDYTDYEDIMTNTMIESLYTEYQSAIRNAIICFGLISIATYLAMTYLFRPIDQIQVHCNMLVNSHNFYKNARYSLSVRNINYLKITGILSPQINRFLHAYNSTLEKLCTNSKTKGSECKHIEQLEYAHKIQPQSYCEITEILSYDTIKLNDDSNKELEVFEFMKKKNENYYI